MELETRNAGALIKLCRSLMLTKSGVDAANHAAQHRALPEVLGVLKAIMGSGTISDPNYAALVPGYTAIVDGFIGSLRSISIFDRLLAGGMRKIPLRTRVSVVTTGATGSIIDEDAAKPISRLTVSAGTGLELKKAVAILVASKELLESAVDGTNQLLTDELRGAVAAVSDAYFLDEILAAAPQTASAGATAADVAADVEWLLDNVTTSARSVLYLVTTPEVAKKLSTKVTTTGALAFPEVGPLGGMLCNMPLLVSDELDLDTSGEIMALIDASAIAGNTDTITIDASEHATLEIDDQPVGDATATMQSLWQNNLKAMRAERWFAFEKIRENGFAVVNGITY